jgi:CheY-like chemotaxis protein
MSRILLVDNEPDLVEVLRMCLESEGHHIMTALDGFEAFEMVSGRNPDLVITDWKMPRVDGLALCRLLRHTQSIAGVPVILLSGDPPRTDQRALLYDAYLRKPVPIERLLTLVSQLVSKQH